MFDTQNSRENRFKNKLICENAVGWAQGSGKRQRVDTTFFVIDFYRLVSEIDYKPLLAPSRLQDSLAFFRSFALVESLAQANRLSVYRLTTPDVGNDYHSCSKLDYENSWGKKQQQNN